MILECIVTTVSTDGICNVAPMGPHVPDGWEQQPEELPDFELKPFAGSRTYQNLLRTDQAVIHFSSDSQLFATAAIGSVSGPEANAITIPIANSSQRRLIRCERYFLVHTRPHEIGIGVDDRRPDDAVAPSAQRLRLACDIIEHGIVDPPRAMNRGAAAVLEAAILATRVQWLDPAVVAGDLRRLQIPVDKTAGIGSKRAFEAICDFVRRQHSL